MAEISTIIANLEKYSDPRVKDYFLMGSPLPISAIMALYILFVVKLGPQMMKNRKAMKIDGMLMAYNWGQIFINSLLFYLAFKYELPKMSIFCSPPLKMEDPDLFIMKLQYCYFLTKVVDLLDTIFFILRKKFTQVTFLHVYHHTFMAISTWIIGNYLVGGQVFFMGLANVFVHAVMYFYYFLTAWNPDYRKNLWWKKYITQLQIVQHFFIFTVFLLPLLNPSCSYPKFPLVLYVINAVIMIYLFVKFYIRSYVRTKQKV